MVGKIIGVATVGVMLGFAGVDVAAIGVMLGFAGVKVATGAAAPG
jgi:hypothetical protein